MTASPTALPAPDGPGSASGAPGLPDGFAAAFTSRYVDTGEVRGLRNIGTGTCAKRSSC